MLTKKMIREDIELKICKDAIYIFMDESGVVNTHPKDPAFCLAGCIIHGLQIDSINESWKRVKYKCFGDENAPFHASSQEVNTFTYETNQVIFNFFKENQFGRFCVGYHDASNLAAYPENRFQLCLALLKEKALTSLLKWYDYKSIHIIFEDTNDTYRSLVLNAFSNFSYTVDNIIASPQILCDGATTLAKYSNDNSIIIPQISFMTKTLNFSCLEIADTLANIGLREIRRNYKTPSTKQGYDLIEVFHSMDPKLVYFLSMETCEINSTHIPHI